MLHRDQEMIDPWTLGRTSLCDIWPMRGTILISVFVAAWNSLPAQISGPMLGHVDHLEANIWLQCHHPCQAGLAVWPSGAPDSLRHIPILRSEARTGHVLKFTVDGLEPGREYQYQVNVNGSTIPYEEPLSFTTPALWRHRTDPPPFSIAFGSCAYINETAYDRPGRPFGNDYGIFDAIADEDPDLMLWLGDNIYLRESDWGSRTGYLHRYTHTRRTPELQRLLRSTKHYAIWDDHDFGPNDPTGSWVHAPIAREMFTLFWANPTYGVPGAEGTVATMFNHSDVDFFLLDNRTHRVDPTLRTVPNAMLGRAQIDWLIQALKYSRAPFKMVAVGGQVLNTAAVFENYATIAAERDDLLRRIEDEGIRGVFFLTGDRHFTELSVIELEDGRKIHDLTVSPLTSGTYAPRENEVNQNRVPGTLVAETHNFAVLSFSGARDERIMRITVRDASGQELWQRDLAQEKKP